ncbi:MAG: 6-hydroxymethylpterin diphosphokinase MptE-like protein [Campylobacterota bacterium]|nr:6-hydroxymethylpterin diphosphokinase MptE-like protein [Campylobacterota bacterium]
MVNMQNIAIETYIKNLKFLEENDLLLFQRLSTLTEYIESEEYHQRYQLEYIEDNGEFDIFDSKTSSFIYNKQPKNFIKDAVNSTSLDKQNTFDLLVDNFYNHSNKFGIDNDTIISKKNQIVVVNDLCEYNNIFKCSTLDSKKEFLSIDKFIFVGTLLGTHIVPMHNKIKASIYLISEMNLEIFRLSLFTTPYSELGKQSTLLFSIMDEKAQFLEKFNIYSKLDYKSNYMIKYYSTNYNIGNYFDRILESISYTSPFKYTYSHVLHTLLGASIQNMGKYSVIDTKTKHNLLENTDVLFLAAGPSLTKNIQWIKEYKNKFIIVAIGATVVKLCENNIVPDLIITMDWQELVENHFPDEIFDMIKDTTILAATMTHKTVLNRLDDLNIYLFEAINKIKDSSSSIKGLSIGEVGLDIVYKLGASQIYLLGTDLSLNQDTGSTHSDNYIHKKIIKIDQDNKKQNNFMKEKNYSISNSTIMVKGNFQDEVITTLLFARSLSIYNKNIKSYIKQTPNIKIYNLNDGAYIDNTITRNIKDISIKSDKKNIDFKSFFNNNSSIGFSIDEKKHISCSLETLEVLQIELNKLKKIKTKTYKLFLEQRRPALTIMTSDLNRFDNLYLDEIFKNYLLITEPYIAYNFNSKIKNESHLIKQIKKVWIRQVELLCNDYKDLVKIILD